LDQDLLWLMAGFVLVIAELLTGTFYLLVLGIAGFAGALVAFLGFDIWIQAVVAAVVAVAGVMWVRARRKQRSPAMPSLDLGQSVSFDDWTSQDAGRARVRYRDSLWDAQIEGAAGSPAPGDPFYIIAVDGSTLRVSARKP
jgi:membrane protein implicated in regulation of membrane protease activity